MIRSAICVFLLVGLVGCQANDGGSTTSTVVKDDEIIEQFHSPAPLDSGMISNIKSNASMVMARLGKVAGKELDYSSESVKWVDGFIERNRSGDTGKLVSVLGSYLGEAIIQNYGGSWVSIKGAPSVRINEKVVTFPFGKVQKQFLNGSEDSIYHYFVTIEEMLKEQN